MVETDIVETLKVLSRSEKLLAGVVQRVSTDNVTVWIEGGWRATNKSGETLKAGDIVRFTNATNPLIRYKVSDGYTPFPQIVVLTQEAYDTLTTEQKKSKIYGIIQEDESNV